MAKKSEIEVAKMKDNFLEDLPFMLKEYANGRDDEMTVGARELKAEIIRILNENGWVRRSVVDDLTTRAYLNGQIDRMREQGHL